MVLLLDFDVDEIAVMNQFPDQGIDLPQRQLWPPLQKASDETVFVDAQLERGCASVLDSRNTELFGERKHAEDWANADLALMPMHGFTECANVSAGTGGAS